MDETRRDLAPWTEERAAPAVAPWLDADGEPDYVVRYHAAIEVQMDGDRQHYVLQYRAVGQRSYTTVAVAVCGAAWDRLAEAADMDARWCGRCEASCDWPRELSRPRSHRPHLWGPRLELTLVPA
ncbi:MAG: hypothetical protein AB7L91_08895 [Dehalococcoidia bacterium]